MGSERVGLGSAQNKRGDAACVATSFEYPEILAIQPRSRRYCLVSWPGRRSTSRASTLSIRRNPQRDEPSRWQQGRGRPSSIKGVTKPYDQRHLLKELRERSARNAPGAAVWGHTVEQAGVGGTGGRTLAGEPYQPGQVDRLPDPGATSTREIWTPYSPTSKFFASCPMLSTRGRPAPFLFVRAHIIPNRLASTSGRLLSVGEGVRRNYTGIYPSCKQSTGPRWSVSNYQRRPPSPV